MYWLPISLLFRSSTKYILAFGKQLLIILVNVQINFHAIVDIFLSICLRREQEEYLLILTDKWKLSTVPFYRVKAISYLSYALLWPGSF